MGHMDAPLSPREAFARLADETRLGILMALWETFDSGTGDNAVPYSTLFDRVAIDDSGNFSYHLQQLIGPFVRKTDAGYELKQTGINVVRAVVAGTVIDDSALGPTQVDLRCPICDAPVEVDYADELMAAACTGCEGILRWNGRPGILFLGLVPPACIEGRPPEGALRAATTYTFCEMAALGKDVCPHCSRPVEATLSVCQDHDPGSTALCPACDRRHLATVRIVCTTCKRSVFPPLATLVLSTPAVTAFYQAHGIDYEFASWETVVRRTEVREDLRATDPLELRLTVPAGDDALELTVDEALSVTTVSG